MDMSITDERVHTTARIECIDAEGQRSSGTGFFFNFCENEDRCVPSLVTNKHVIEGAKVGVFHFNVLDSNGDRAP